MCIMNQYIALHFYPENLRNSLATANFDFVSLMHGKLCQKKLKKY